MTEIVVDQIRPAQIIEKVAAYGFGFAESFKGEGSKADGNFQDFNTSWRRESATDVQNIWLEMLRRNLIPAARAGCNFIEFWGMPEVRCRDDGTARVTARLRIIRVTHVHQPRPN